MMPRHEHMYPSVDKIPLVSSVTWTEKNMGRVRSLQARWRSFPCGFVRRLTCIFPSTPVVSILLATFTLFPQMSYWGFWAPITPAITGPWFIPKKQKQITNHMAFTSALQIILMLIFVLWRNVLTDSESEVVEGVFVDDIQLPNKSKGKFHHGADVHVLSVMFLREMQGGRKKVKRAIWPMFIYVIFKAIIWGDWSPWLTASISCSELLLLLVSFRTETCILYIYSFECTVRNIVSFQFCAANQYTFHGWATIIAPDRPVRLWISSHFEVSDTAFEDFGSIFVFMSPKPNKFVRAVLIVILIVCCEHLHVNLMNLLPTAVTECYFQHQQTHH